MYLKRSNLRFLRNKKYCYTAAQSSSFQYNKQTNNQKKRSLSAIWAPAVTLANLITIFIIRVCNIVVVVVINAYYQSWHEN